MSEQNNLAQLDKNEVAVFAVGEDEIETINSYPLADVKLRAQVSELSTKIDEITNPFNITSFSINPSTAQKGSSVNVVLKWAYSQNIVEQTINNQSLETSVREKTYTAVTADTTYTLKGISENDVEKSKSVSVKFYNGIYYGKSNSSSYNAALINSFTKVLSDSKVRTVTVNAGSGEYIFYCLPTRLGTPSFNVGGFDGGFSKVATVNFTNSDNFAENYDIYKSDNANLGNTTVVVK